MVPLIDGTVFDSSYQRGQPAEFPVNGVLFLADRSVDDDACRLKMASLSAA